MVRTGGNINVSAPSVVSAVLITNNSALVQDAHVLVFHFGDVINSGDNVVNADDEIEVELWAKLSGVNAQLRNGDVLSVSVGRTHVVNSPSGLMNASVSEVLQMDVVMPELLLQLR